VLSKNQKRFILILIALIVSIIIWNINASWGNNFLTCLILSITTFLLIYTPFEIYWSFRDLWFDRWKRIKPEEFEIRKIIIDVNGGKIHGELVINRDKNLIEKVRKIIIIAHGFSDTKESLQYYYYPIALQGYIIFAYDARGIGESKKVGRRSDFIKRIDDFNRIIDWVKNQREFDNFDIYCAGFSIGAITVLCGGFLREDIKKIIAISAVSLYRQNLPKYNLLILFSYALKGVKLFPNKNENEQLSPYLILKKAKATMHTNIWETYAKKILLIHSKNDKIIKFKNFIENREILSINYDRHIILKKGGHSHKKNELALVGASLRFFDTN